MPELRYETHITSDPRLPFIIYGEMIITNTFFNPVPNWHDDIELISCRRGRGYVLMDGKRVDFQAGDTVIIKPLVIHNVFSDDSVSFFPVTPGRDFCISNGIVADDTFFPQIINDAEIDRLFCELEADYESYDSRCRVARIRRSVLNILIMLTEKYGNPVEKTLTHEKHNFARVRDTIKYIRDNYASEISIDAVARKVGINKYSLSREFKEITGTSMIAYLNNYRCRVAYDYICGGLSVSEAANLCGFNNISYFSKTFRSVIGILPSEVGHGNEKNIRDLFMI